MKAKWLTIPLVCIFAATVVTGCSDADNAASPEIVAQADAIKPIAVSIAEVKEGILSDTNKIIGEITANTDISILSKAPGTLVELAVKKGDEVKNGQVIGKMEQTDYLLRVKQAQTSLEIARANLNQAKRVDQASSAGSANALAKRAVDLAQDQYDRTKELVTTGALPAVQLEQAETALLQAKAQLTQAEKGDTQSSTSIEIAQANVKQAQVGIEQAQSALRDTVIKATADGIITDVMVEVGDAVNLQAPVAKLVNFDPAVVKLNITESNLSKFKKDSLLDVNIPSQSRVVKGKVTYVGYEADAQSKMFPVELRIANPDLSVLPGMKADVMLTDTSGKKGLLVPVDAILEADGKNWVYVVKGDQAEKREVVLSEGNSTYVMAQSGLQAGEKVVVKGYSELKDDSKIRIVD